MSTVSTHLPSSGADIRKADEVAATTVVSVGSQQSTSFLQLAMTALRLTTATPSNDRNNNNNNNNNSNTTLQLRKQITLDEVSYHDTFGDCWIVLYDRVYDITNVLRLHPGGHDVLLEHAGRDATIAFIGTGHSKEAYESLKHYEIGELPPHERIYRCKGMLSAAILPD